MSKKLESDNIEIEKVKKLQRKVAGLSEKSEQIFIQSIWSLVRTLEAKDTYTKKHSENVTMYAVGIAEALNMSSRQIETIQRAAMLHDIGKIGIPDAILSKPARLTPRESQVVEQHPVIAVRILSKMSFLKSELRIIKHHHEKWNGQGYPDGLASNSIPLGSRILAVADTLDALTSERPYHNPRTVCQALEILNNSSGYEFDAKVIEALMIWTDSLAKKKDPPGELTTEDLRDSQLFVAEPEPVSAAT
jgi:putative nucleotidyltransferase with HDIG domain